jgi:hypothetical protein
LSGVWRDTQVSSPVTIQSRKSAGFWMKTAILNTHCEHNVAVTVAGELCPVIRLLSHTARLPFLRKKIPFIFTGLASLLSEYPSYWVFKSKSKLLYDWRFTANQFVLTSSPLKPTTRDFFFHNWTLVAIVLM